MKKIFLKQSLSKDVALKGEIKGIAYSGAVIKEHGFFSNLVVDTATLAVERDKLPILRDHFPSQVAGYGLVTISDNQVLIDGKLLKKSTYAQEIMNLAEDDFEWQMSLGVYEGDWEEVTEPTTVNGIEITSGTIIRNGLLREISVVAIGADSETIAEVFSSKEGDIKFMLTKEQWVKLACGCGGSKETTPEELQGKFEADQEKIKELEDQVAAKEAEINALKEAIAAEKAKDEADAREEQLKSAAKAKNLEFTAEKIKKAASSKESTDLLLSVIEDMKEQPKQIDPKFAGKEDLGGKEPAKTTKSESEIRLAAKKLVADGKAKDLLEAYSLVEVK